MSFIELARAAAWALRHPRYQQPTLALPVGTWVTWIERDVEGRAVKLCYAEIETVEQGKRAAELGLMIWAK